MRHTINALLNATTTSAISTGLGSLHYFVSHSCKVSYFFEVINSQNIEVEIFL